MKSTIMIIKKRMTWSPLLAMDPKQNKCYNHHITRSYKVFAQPLILPPKGFYCEEAAAGKLLRKSLLTKHGGEVDQKATRLLSASWKSKKCGGSECGSKAKFPIWLRDPWASVGRLKQNTKRKVFPSKLLVMISLAFARSGSSRVEEKKGKK